VQAHRASVIGVIFPLQTGAAAWLVSVVAGRDAKNPENPPKKALKTSPGQRTVQA